MSDYKPFIKWVGGKRRILPAIREYIPVTDGIYCEPFLGGGATAIDAMVRMPDASFVFSDANPRLVNAWTTLARDPDAMLGRLREMERAWNDACEFDRAYMYMHVRRHFNTATSGTENAAEFVFLNRACFNGLYRENARGEFNTPVGDRSALCFDTGSMRALSDLIDGRDVRFMCESFDATAIAHSGLGSGDVCYMDPPYTPETKDKGSYVHYCRNGWTDAHDRRLRETMFTLKARGVRVVLSDSVAWADRMPCDWHVHYVSGLRSVNRDGSGRGNVKEVCVTPFEV